MFRSLALMVLVVTTACGASGVRTERAAPPSPAGEGRIPTPFECDESPAPDPIHERRPDDPDYWIEALVFGASGVADQEAGGE